MQNEQSNLKAIFHKIFAGTASRTEKERIARWLSRLDVSERELSFEEVEKQRLQLQKNFHARFVEPAPGRKAFRLHAWLPAAVAAMLIIIAGVLLFSPRSPRLKEIHYTETFTNAGERKIITLSDGSKITLNNSSRIKFPQVFADSVREVFLDGEALFDISHNKEKPFIVKTENLRIQVLGTSFDVRNYITDDKAAVTVASGKVGVLARGKKDYQVLTPGQQLSYSPKTGLVERTNVNAGDYTGWQKGELIFKNEPLEVICKRLERWYDVKITIKSTVLKNKKISLEQRNESLQNVMKMLAIAGGFRYRINGKDVQIW